VSRNPEKPHLAISASAGSGKTFQLAHRFIGLMADGVQPERICALTFSRKAAGEIFDGIVEYLCRAARDEEAARLTAQRIERRGLDRAGFLSILRLLLSNLNRLHIGTLDSFIVGVVRAFPIELGVAVDFNVFDEGGSEAGALRREVLDSALSGGSRGKTAGQLFEAFKQATFGQEEKAVGDRLDKFIEEHRFRYRMLPDANAWGKPEIIWPGGCDWMRPAKGLEAAAGELRRDLRSAGLPGDVIYRWEAFIDAVLNFVPGAPWTKPLDYLFSRLAAGTDPLRDGKGSIKIGRKAYELTPRQAGAALKLMRHVMRCELKAALQRTLGIFRVLDRFEHLYDANMRRTGCLTFSDAQYLLTKSNRCSGGALLSREADQEGRLYIDYRLDARLDHWLLDEFQDTSDLQWAVLSNLIDETLQDDSGSRSFFCVGDVKQAIYGWRGGNARLFGRILRDYGGRIEQRHLATSFRSSQPVIETVNEVFGNLEHPELPAGAVSRWREGWQQHRCEPDKAPSEGYAAIIEPCHADGETKPGPDDRYHAVACLLREIRPLEKGLSTAVLVRSNAAGKALVDRLRFECPGLSCAHEGPAAIVDNPVVSLLLSLIRFAAHPGDTFARRHLEMSPLKGVFDKQGLTFAALPGELLHEMHTAGFQSFVRAWGRKLDEASPLDGFGQVRLEDLCNAAAEFDASESRDPAAFPDFVEGYQIKDIGAGNGVRVMTIHQAKGLGFDLVILPDLMNGRSMSSAGSLDFATCRDTASDRPRWTLKMPRRAVAGVDPVLAELMRAADQDACMDDLCVLYVAMTRAKRGLYLVTSYPGPGSRAVTPAAFVKQRLLDDPKPAAGPARELGGDTFTVLFERGQSDWYRRLGPRPAPAAEPPLAGTPPENYAELKSSRKRLMLVEPSAQEAVVRPAAALFSRENRDVLDFGSAIHHLFEQIAWIEEADVSEILRNWRKAADVSPDVERDVSRQFAEALESAEVRKALSRPEGRAELWREKRFEIVLGDGEWISGAFDRVIIHRDAGGCVTRAEILDYKSNRVETESQIEKTAEGYRPQLSLYRRALARILAVPSSAISLRLLFTRPARVYDL